MKVGNTKPEYWLELGVSLPGLAQHSTCCLVLRVSFHPLLTPGFSASAAKPMKQEVGYAVQHLAFPLSHVP